VQVGDGLDIEQQIVLCGHGTRSLTRQAAHDLDQPFSYRVEKRSGELGATASRHARDVAGDVRKLWLTLRATSRLGALVA
jgi:hypothetical protein